MTERPNSARRGESGFALLLVFVLAAGIAISLMMQMPRVCFETQRDREEMLIERGEQYKRAIALYVRKFGRYPAKIEDLENTNDIRFLRRRYIDPMTGKDEWRILHAGPGGVLLDSLVQKAPGLGPDGKPLQASGNTPGSPGMNTASMNTAGGMNVNPGNTGATADPNQPVEVNQAVKARPSDRPMGLRSPGVPPQPGQPGYDPNQPNQTAQNPYGYQPYPQTGQYPQQQVYPGQMNQTGQPGDPNASQQQTQPYPNQTAYPQPGQTVQTGYPQPGQPGYPAPGQTGYPVPGQTGYPVPGQPGYSQTGQPGSVPAYPQPGVQLPQYPGQYPGQTATPGYGVQPGTYQPPGTFNQGQQTGLNNPNQSSFNNPGQSGLNNPGQGAAAQMIQQMLTSPRQMPTGLGGTTGMNSQSMGGGIAGVATKYKGPSIKIYDERQKYQEWEFVYDPQKEAAKQMPAMQTGQNPGNSASGFGQQSGSGQPGFGSGFGQSGSGSGQSGFGQSGSQSSFGQSNPNSGFGRPN